MPRPSLIVLLWSLAAAAIPAAAQFAGLTTDDTGSRVWFSSDLRLRSTAGAAAPASHERAKLFEVTAGGVVRLARERPVTDLYHLLTQPEVSGDGAVITFRTGFFAFPGQTCRQCETLSTVAATAGGAESTLAGLVRLSRNGRYLLRYFYPYEGPTGQIQIVDRVTGAARAIPVSNLEELQGARLITPAGTALIHAAGSLWLARSDGTTQRLNARLPALVPSRFFDIALHAAMDDAASTIVYQTVGSPTASLELIRPGDNDPRPLVTAAEGATNPVLSADGRRVLFLSRANWSGGRNEAGRRQAWIVSTESGQIQPVTNEEAGIAEATLSASGQAAWAITFAGSLLHIDLNGGIAREIIPRTTVIDRDALDFPLRAAAGSLARITGRGLTASLTAAGRSNSPAPILAVSPTEILFQVPWDWSGPIELSTPPSPTSPFEQIASRTAEVQAAHPAILLNAGGFPIIAHDDFHGLVSEDDPARPGEILHFYVSGLGPVSPPVETGRVTPSSPLSPTTLRVFAFWAGELQSNFPFRAEVLFAGLAPGTIGVYQVSIRVPDTNLPYRLGLNIQTEASGGAATGFPVRAR